MARCGLWSNVVRRIRRARLLLSCRPLASLGNRLQFNATGIGVRNYDYSATQFGLTEQKISFPLDSSCHDDKILSKKPRRIQPVEASCQLDFQWRAKCVMVEKIKRCPYCHREAIASGWSFVENPYCNECLQDRLADARASTGPIGNRRINGLIEAVPMNGTLGADA